MLSARICLVLLLCLGSCKRSRAPAPKPVPVTPAPGSGPLVVALLRNDGVLVRVQDDNIGPGCDGPGPGVAVPATGAAPDVDLVRQCLEKLKTSQPPLALERSIEIVADKDTPYASVIAVMDAARTTHDGKELFPDVLFGAPGAGFSWSSGAAPSTSASAPAPAPVARPTIPGALFWGQRAVLSGKLIKKDVDDVAFGHSKAPFLVLDKPISVQAPPDAGAGEDADPQVNQRELQVGFDDYAGAQAFVGKRVTISGELAPQITAHHFSPVLLLSAKIVR